MPIFVAMHLMNDPVIVCESKTVNSIFLDREVIVDFLVSGSVTNPAELPLLLINDGQNIAEMGLTRILEDLYRDSLIRPVFCVAIHANEDRKMEYGVAGVSDFMGRGAKAENYSRFIIEELIPLIHENTGVSHFSEYAFAGFSLGGLFALDITWQHPEIFSIAGVFSGSLWWRSLDQDDPSYDDNLHRIMHQKVRNGNFNPGQRFYFQCGNKDETSDRNNNGIIDSIDDTLDLVNELTRKGYQNEKDIRYFEMPEGRHDTKTWAEAMPDFLQWAWPAK